MKHGFYIKIAWTGIKNNRRLFFPYLFTGVGMVMMYYIVAFLSVNTILKEIPGGGPMQSMLDLGCSVLNIFILIFLFYTNSFLIRRRKKEFGLYNILGMGKGNLARVQFWESLITTILTLAGGLIFGIAFSKLAELVMVNIMYAEVGYTFSVSFYAVLRTCKWFGLIYLLIFLNTLRQIGLSNPIELLRSENTGEKPPKANWVLAVLGVLILAAAYFLAVKIEDPIAAIMWFFVAVAMVIVATYLIFIAGSVTLCRILQKRKKYYYKAAHFVSVSSMSYRMKRNGAGLASICILSTIVLVMLSSSICLYVGEEEILNNRYPRDINLDVTLPVKDFRGETQLLEISDRLGEIIGEDAAAISNLLEYHGAVTAGVIDQGTVSVDASELSNYYTSTNVWQIFLIPLEDYNHLMNQQETLDAGEVLVCSTKKEYDADTISFGSQTMKVAGRVPEFVDNGIDAAQIIPTMFLILPDFETIQRIGGEVGRESEEGFEMEYYLTCGFDMDAPEEAQSRMRERILKTMKQMQEQEESTQEETMGASMTLTCSVRAAERNDFYGLYGGLFFLGVLLGIVFLFAAVLIMYYKQISEGYEDQSRFEIMRKVGMTRKDIRKSINSQILTVFFLPLLMAGLHLSFAFPIVRRLLLLFSLTNTGLLIMTTAGCYLIFALFYVVVYRITSRAYYSIVV